MSLMDTSGKGFVTAKDLHRIASMKDGALGIDSQAYRRKNAQAEEEEKVASEENEVSDEEDDVDATPQRQRGSSLKKPGKKGGKKTKYTVTTRFQNQSSLKMANKDLVEDKVASTKMISLPRTTSLDISKFTSKKVVENAIAPQARQMTN